MNYLKQLYVVGWLGLAGTLGGGCDRLSVPEVALNSSNAVRAVAATLPLASRVPPAPDTVPLRTILALKQAQSNPTNVSFVRIQGTILDQRMGEYVVINDQTGTVLAETHQPNLPPVKAAVEVLGQLVSDGLGISLKYALVSPLADSSSTAETPLFQNVKPASLPVLTKAWTVRDLSAEKAAWNFPVRLHAVVTVNTKLDHAFYVQDDSAGIYVSGDTIYTNLNPGDLVTVEGVSDPGGFAPIVRCSKVTATGCAPLPEPRAETLFQLATGQDGSQWIEVRGIVRALTYTNGVAQLSLHDFSGAITVNVPTAQAPENLLDAVVRIQGVCFSIANSQRQFMSFAMQVSSLESVQIEEPGAADPLILPVQPIATLGQFHPRQTLQHRVNIAGLVTVVNAESFFLQDADEGVQVFATSLPPLKPGDYVVAAGYPGFGNFGYRLDYAVLKIISHRPLPTPQLLTAQKSLQPQWHNRWVKTQARLLRQTVSGDAAGLTLQLGERVFEARVRLPDAAVLKNLEPGSLVEITGLYRVLADEARMPSAFELTVISAADIKILERPTWWSFTHTIAVIGGLVTLIGATILWVALLRQKVRQQTAKLRQSERKFRSLVEKSLVGVYIIQAGRFVYANPRLAEIFGYRQEDLTTRDILQELIAPEDRALVTEQIRRRLADEIEQIHYFFRGQRQDGTFIQIEVLGSRTEYAGQPAVLGMLLDVTERQLAQDKISAQAQLLELANDAIVVFDVADKILYWNQSAQRIYEVSPEAAVGELAFEKMAMPPADFQKAKLILTRDKHWHGEYVHRKPAGEEVTVQSRWTLLEAAPGKPASILTINSDVSQQKKLEGQFLRSQRLESVGVLAGGIAHDLNNTLVPIMMSAHLLEMDPDANERKTLTENIISSTERAANLVKQILTFARGTDGRRTLVQPQKILEELRKILGQTLPKSIHLKLTIPPEVWPVAADATQLHQALLNLCINARDAMPAGGELTVGLDSATLDEHTATLNPAAKPGDYVIFSITDNGSGMTPEVRDRIFDPFFTTKEIGKGTGLGLSTTLGIIKSHSGFITVYSVPAQGTCFKIYLPAQTNGQTTDAEPKREDLAAYRGNNELILVVDDEAPIATIAQKTLQLFGYRVITAANGAEAIACYSQPHTTFALVLMDMMMPVLDGPATIHALVRINPAIKIIASSGLVNEGPAKKIHPAVCGFIHKPYTTEQILKTVHAALHPLPPSA